MQLLFGFTKGSLSEIAENIELALGIRFELHESDMRGGDYYRYETDAEQIILQCNSDGGDVAEDDFANIPILLYVGSDTRSQQEVSSCLANWAILLRPK